MALGQAMIENTAAQERLNSALVSADANRVIEIARDYGAVGWKLNGAGGRGRLGDAALRPAIPPEAGHDPRDRAGKPALPQHPDLP